MLPQRGLFQEHALTMPSLGSRPYGGSGEELGSSRRSLSSNSGFIIFPNEEGTICPGGREQRPKEGVGKLGVGGFRRLWVQGRLRLPPLLQLLHDFQERTGNGYLVMT